MTTAVSNPDLFGNEAGEDEEPEVLDSYFVKKPEFDRFFSANTKIAFVRSRKGMGKSALLKKFLYDLEQTRKDEISIYIKASDLISIQDLPTPSAAAYVHAWQQRICTRINLELGSALRLGVSDDSIYLIENAEVVGFRNRNIVSALFDRFQVKGLGTDVARTRIAGADSQAILSRVQDKKDVNVWLLIDDIDATFINTEHERLKVSSFFSAVRNLVNSVNGLLLRASVRTDVWSIISQHDEALDKCEQYMLDLSWSTAETGMILTNKIRSYFLRNHGDDERFNALDAHRDAGKIRQLVFQEPFRWAGRPLESFRPIHILCGGRPRWAAQLCKLAGNDAVAKQRYKISVKNIEAAMKRYGQLRVSDLYKEHHHQCSNLQDIIEIFSGGRTRYSTDELLQHITEKYIRHRGSPTIDGVPVVQGSIGLAHFLYRVGFICARDEQDPSGLGFIRFEDRPNLLSTVENLDDGLDWEIHPSYRSVLRIQRTSSAEDLF